MNSLDEKTLCFLVANRFKSNYNMIDLSEYLAENYKTIDCSDVKKNFMIVSPNGADLKEALIGFIESRLDPEKDIPSNLNADDIINSGFDYFYDIEYKDDDTAIIEPGTDD